MTLYPTVDMGEFDCQRQSRTYMDVISYLCCKIRCSLLCARECPSTKPGRSFIQNQLVYLWIGRNNQPGIGVRVCQHQKQTRRIV
jgi:hypothetical protein